MRTGLSLSGKKLKLDAPTHGLLVAGVLTVLASLGCGPAKPVVIFTPPSVVTDPMGTRRPPRVVSTSKTFWEAMSTLDTGFINRHEVTIPQRAFARALGLIMAGHPDEAELALDSIRVAYQEDTEVRAAARILLTAMLQYQDKWTELAELHPLTRGDSITPPERDKAEVQAWAAAFRRVAPRRLSFPERTVTLPLRLSPTGTPMIQVTINGKPKLFWLDTGSSMSIVASDVAIECGISPLLEDTLEVATATGRVPARPSFITKLEIGGIDIANSTAMIVDSDLLQVRLSDRANAPIAKIDGVIGFDIISRLEVRIDYLNRRVTLLKPRQSVRLPRTGRNLFWVGTPIVRLVTPRGLPLHFLLDTGAQETYGTENLLKRTKVQTINGERQLLGGFAGITIVRGRFIPELRVNMAGEPLLFRRVFVFAPAYKPFVTLDGILGSDIGRGGVVRIDATNGLFVIEAEEYDAGLRIGS